MDSHAILTPSQIENARIVFNAFADTSIGNSPVPTHMGVLSVLQYLATIGIRKTENEVKDFIMVITQSSSLPEESSTTAPPAAPTVVNSTGTRRASTPSQSGKSKRRASSKPSIPAQVQMTPVQPPLDPSATTTLLLSFENFISLTLYTFEKSSGGDCDKSSELRGAFSDMDIDKDGALSVSDLRNSLNKHFVEPFVKSSDKKGQRAFRNPHEDLAKLTNAQLATILSELDIGSDGVVSFEDFVSAIETA